MEFANLANMDRSQLDSLSTDEAGYLIDGLCDPNWFVASDKRGDLTRYLVAADEVRELFESIVESNSIKVQLHGDVEKSNRISTFMIAVAKENHLISEFQFSQSVKISIYANNIDMQPIDTPLSICANIIVNLGDASRIRLCEICGDVFWAKRKDSYACCKKHLDALRSRNNRRRKKNIKDRRAQEQTTKRVWTREKLKRILNTESNQDLI